MKALVVAVGLLLAVAPAVAVAPAELAERARSAARGDGGAQDKVLALGRLSVAFIDLADEASLRGGKASAELRAAFAAIHDPLADIQRRQAAVMEAGEKEVITADGDLEAWYDSPRYQEAQRVAANALYYLNWLRYYGASLHGGEAGKRMLREARDGFAGFAAGDAASELAVESRLGRGLCALELGDVRDAIGDLKAVAGSAQASAERKRRAQLSLLEAYAESGQTRAALDLSQQLLKDAAASEANWLRFMRLQALIAAAEDGGSGAAALRSEAVALMDRLRRAGGAWEQRVTALAQEAFADPDAWAESARTPFAQWELAKLYVKNGDYAGATPLLEAVIASDDRSVVEHRTRARYFLGLARFRAGDHAPAAEQLAAALDGGAGADAAERTNPLDAKERADAAYLLFKAREALAAAAGAEADLEALAAAARAFVADHATHEAAFEAWYRLAELAQLQGDFAAAIDDYAKVQGDPALELQAAFATAQCRFELYQQATDVDQRAEALAAVGSALDAFEAGVARFEGQPAGDVPWQAMGAKAAIMRAVARKLVPEGDPRAVLTALEDFEERFPEEAERLAQVVRLRLEALLALGDFAAARSQLELHRERLLAELGRAPLEEMAVAFIRAGARSSGSEAERINTEAQQAALAIYEGLAAQDDAGTRTKLTLARLRENTGDRTAAAELYEQVLASGPASTTALRGLARIAEAEGRSDDALGYWRRLGEAVRPGDLPWYESHYERARVLEAGGRAKASCELLEGLRPAMPGLADQELRTKLGELYDRVCG